MVHPNASRSMQERSSRLERGFPEYDSARRVYLSFRVLRVSRKNQKKSKTEDRINTKTKKLLAISLVLATGVTYAVHILVLSLHAPIRAPETDNSTENFLFFEVCMLPPEVREPECQYLVGASFLDFPTYYFDESTGSLRTDIAPDPYDIEFNESLRFIIGESAIWCKSGACSHLELVYVVPYSFYLRPGYGQGYSTNLSAIGKISVTDITMTGLLVIHFDDQDIRLAPWDDWGKQV